MNFITDENRRKIEKKLRTLGGNSDAILSALEELHSIYETETIEWLAKLYCADVGGFYYSESARLGEGFLPDIESTIQALNFLLHTGLIKSFSDIPGPMKEQIKKFVLSLFDPTDGYIYHPQWGKDIDDARRGRDLRWAMSIAKGLEFAFSAPTAVERRGNVGGTSSSCAGLDYLSSKRAFRRYLSSLEWAKRPFDAGNLLAAQSKEIVAAGLGEVAIDFLNGIQNPKNGSWGAKSGYQAINPLSKVVGFYTDIGAPIPRAVRAAEEILGCMTSTHIPDTISWQYNCWLALYNILENLRTHGGERGVKDAAYIQRKAIRIAPEAILSTRDKLLLFKKEHSTFSYLKDRSACKSQGVMVAAPNTKEGDINATLIGSSGITGRITPVLGIAGMGFSIYNPSDFGIFLESVKLN